MNNIRLSDSKDSENDWELDINIDEKDYENNKLNKNSLNKNNNEKLNLEDKQKDFKKDLKNKDNNKDKDDINNIYETYDKDFTIIDSKIPSINNRKIIIKNPLNNEESNKEKNNQETNKINNLNKINVDDYNFQKIKNNSILCDYSN